MGQEEGKLLIESKIKKLITLGSGKMDFWTAGQVFQRKITNTAQKMTTPTMRKTMMKNLVKCMITLLTINLKKY